MSSIVKQALRTAAESTINILENIAGFEPSDIDDDSVELRFETEGGFDTGCDVSIVDQCQKAADVIRALLDERDSLESFRIAFTEFHDKTEWVQGDKRFDVITPWGKHRADALKQYIDHLEERLEAAEKRITELGAREVNPVAWMRNANVTSFMSRFTTDENYAVEQWGDDAVALYSLPVAFIPACFTDERNLMYINERGRETSLIWSDKNSESGDIKLFRIAAAAGKGE